MVHYIVLFRLKDGTDESRIEEILRETRIHLLRLPEARSVRCGKRIPPAQEWPFFLAMDFDSRDKMRNTISHPVYVKFSETVLKPLVSQSLALEFELDPLKDVRYS